MALSPLRDTGPAPVFTGRDVLWTTAAMLGGFALLLVTLTVLKFVLEMVDPDSVIVAALNGEFRNYLVSATEFFVQMTLIIGAVYFVALRRNHHDWSIFGLRPLRWSGVGAALITTVVLTLLGFALVNTAARFELPYAPQRFGMASGSIVELLVLLPIVAILAPMAEEILFRGVVYSWLRRRWGFWTSALFSALPFGLVHLEPLVIIFATTVGMILAFLYERYENLWVPIIAHCANNCGAVLWVFFGLNRFFQ